MVIFVIKFIKCKNDLNLSLELVFVVRVCTTFRSRCSLTVRIHHTLMESSYGHGLLDLFFLFVHFQT